MSADIQQEEQERVEDEKWFRARMEEEEMARSDVHFVALPRTWHPVISPVRKTLLEQRQKIASGLKRAWSPGEPNWEALDSMNDGLLTPRHKSYCLRVSSVTVDRALAAANALLWAAEKRGCSCCISRNAERFQIHLDCTHVSFAIRERQEEQMSKHGYKERVPTDRLALVIEHNFRTKFEIADEPDALIQHRLHAVFPKLYHYVVISRARKRVEQKMERLRLKEGAEKLAVREAAAAVEAARIQAQCRLEELLGESLQWRRTRDLLDYINALEEAMKRTGESYAHTGWFAEARQIAASLDPLAARLQKLRA